MKDIDTLLKEVKRIHFIGIGGSGMCPLAEILLSLGYQLSGSDNNDTETFRRIEKEGAKVYLGQTKANLTPERQRFRLAEQMGWVYQVYRQRASLKIKKRVFQMGEYISGFPSDFWVSYQGDPLVPADPELEAYITDLQTWVAADGATIGVECITLHGVITLCIENKAGRPGYADVLRRAFEAEGVRVLEAVELEKAPYIA